MRVIRSWVVDISTASFLLNVETGHTSMEFAQNRNIYMTFLENVIIIVNGSGFVNQETDLYLGHQLSDYWESDRKKMRGEKG